MQYGPNFHVNKKLADSCRLTGVVRNENRYKLTGACTNWDWEPAAWLEPKTASGPGTKSLVRGRRLPRAESILRLKYACIHVPWLKLHHVVSKVSERLNIKRASHHKKIKTRQSGNYSDVLPIMADRCDSIWGFKSKLQTNP